MPEWVKDESTWKQAKEAAKKSYKESDEGFWGTVTNIYKNMGGKIASSYFTLLESCVSSGMYDSIDQARKYALSMWITNAKSGKNKPILAIDFDNTVAEYDKFEYDKFGDPLLGAVEALKELKKRGYVLILFTCRQDTPNLREYIKKWDLPFDGVNTTKYNHDHTSDKPEAYRYIDDKNVKFTNWNNVLDELPPTSEIESNYISIGVPIPHIPIIEDIAIWNKAYEIAKNTSQHEPDSKDFILEMLKMFEGMGGLESAVNYGRPPTELAKKYQIIGELIKKKRYDLAKEFIVAMGENNLTIEVMEEVEAEYSDGCLTVDISPSLDKKVLSIGERINPSLLVNDGLEKNTHVTLLFGIDDNLDDKLKNLKFGNIDLKNRPVIEYFDNEKDNNSVAMVRIESEGLHKIHNILRKKYPNKQFPGPYKPHVTIAYIKLGARLSIKSIPVYNWTVDRINMSHKDESKSSIALAYMDTNNKVNPDKNSFRSEETGKQFTDIIKRTTGIDIEALFEGSDTSGSWSIGKKDMSGDFIKVELTMLAGIKNRIMSRVTLIKNGWEAEWIGEDKQEYIDYALESLSKLLNSVKTFIAQKGLEITKEGNVRSKVRLLTEENIMSK